MRWYRVDSLGADALHKRYLETHGVYANRANQIRWLTAPSQQLAVFENNENVHTHACGEYGLEQLQIVIKPEVVVEYLRRGSGGNN